MYCKMDVDDLFKIDEYRRINCKCKTYPTLPKKDYGCRCEKCKKTCRQCIGFGWVNPPNKKVNNILRAIKTRLKMHNLPPGFIRVRENDIKILLAKRKNEADDHWIRDYVDIEPLRIFDILVVIDRRKY